MERLKEAYEKEGFEVFPISAATNKGLDELLTKVAEILKNYPEDIVFEEEYEEYDEVAVDQEPFTIEVEDGVYVVRGVGVEKMIGYTNIDTEKGFAFFQRYLKEKRHHRSIGGKKAFRKAIPFVFTIWNSNSGNNSPKREKQTEEETSA